MPTTTDTTTTQYRIQSLCTSRTPGDTVKMASEESSLREGGGDRRGRRGGGGGRGREGEEGGRERGGGEW